MRVPMTYGQRLDAALLRGITVLAFSTAVTLLLALSGNAEAAPAQGAHKMTGKYADIDGLKMYYEIHGKGEPIVVIHGGFMNIPSNEPLITALAKSRQVIAVELEGHGRTADLDRPLSYEQFARDVAGLVRKLELKQTDVLGFSMGGATAFRMAIDNPDLVRRLIVISGNTSNEAFYPSIVAQWPGMSPEGFKSTPMAQAYQELSPNPKHWPVFIEKMKTMMMNFKGWSEAEVRSIKAPTLLVIADADLIRPEYTLGLFRLLGGAPAHGGMGPLPASQLAILPGTTHFNIVYRTDLLMPVVNSFLDTKAQPAPTSPAAIR